VTGFGSLLAWYSISTVGPAGSDAVLTLFSWKARVAALRAGTSVDLAVATVGAAVAGCQLTTTVLSLSVNVTEVFVVDRAQPSGTEILKPPAEEVYGTYAVLSGMSPGGLLSTATGDSVDTGDWAGVGEVVRPDG
jgi:hypothetical protein